MWTRLFALVERLRFVPARRRLCDEAAQELDSHLELLTARYVESGMAPDEARLAARRQLGNPVGECSTRAGRVGAVDEPPLSGPELAYAIVESLCTP